MLLSGQIYINIKLILKDEEEEEEEEEEEW